LNLAAIWALPVVFVIENNLYGEYSRIQLTTPVLDLAERASAYAMPSEIVDGQSVDAVRAAMDRAVDRARSGGGPTLLEMKTYRYSGHSRADQATYRPAGELDEWLQRDPITLYADVISAAQGVEASELLSRADSVQAAVAVASDIAMASPEPPVRDLFAFVGASAE
jgi:pyruvate dehydrogenase E1 component alpha subunit